MAETAFRANLTASETYTVPAGKLAVFSANLMSYGNVNVLIGGVAVGNLVAASGTLQPFLYQLKPLTAAAGQVISRTDSGLPANVGIVGMLYDVDT
jgi:hypothetical protein